MFLTRFFTKKRLLGTSSKTNKFKRWKFFGFVMNVESKLISNPFNRINLNFQRCIKFLKTEWNLKWEIRFISWRSSSKQSFKITVMRYMSLFILWFAVQTCFFIFEQKFYFKKCLKFPLLVNKKKYPLHKLSETPFKQTGTWVVPLSWWPSVVLWLPLFFLTKRN